MALKYLAKIDKATVERIKTAIAGLVLAWDPDFTKATPAERKHMKEAEKSGFVPEDEVDWNNLNKYA